VILRLLQLNCWLYSCGDDRVALEGVYAMFDYWAETQS
jgi:hypothetical protein